MNYQIINQQKHGPYVHLLSTKVKLDGDFMSLEIDFLVCCSYSGGRSADDVINFINSKAGQ